MRVSFTDDESFDEELTSDAYPATGMVAATTLVGNLNRTDHGQVPVGRVSGVQDSLAVAFTTGAAGGHTLTRVDFRLENVGANAHPKVTIAAANSADPGSTVYTLTDPASLSDNAVNGFAAPADAHLDPGTTYFVVVENTNTTDSAAARFDVEYPGDDGNDSGSLIDWSIANRGRWRAPTAWAECPPRMPTKICPLSFCFS